MGNTAISDETVADPMADPLLQTAHAEPMRAHQFFATLPEPTHWIQIALTDTIDQQITASDGVLSEDTNSHRRLLDIDARVGTPELDSTHKMLDGGFGSRQVHFSELVPITTEPQPLKMLLWGA